MFFSEDLEERLERRDGQNVGKVSKWCMGIGKLCAAWGAKQEE